MQNQKMCPCSIEEHTYSLGADEKGSEVAGLCYCPVSEGLTVDPL